MRVNLKYALGGNMSMITEENVRKLIAELQEKAKHYSEACDRLKKQDRVSLSAWYDGEMMGIEEAIEAIKKFEKLSLKGFSTKTCMKKSTTRKPAARKTVRK